MGRLWRSIIRSWLRWSGSRTGVREQGLGISHPNTQTRQGPRSGLDSEEYRVVYSSHPLPDFIEGRFLALRRPVGSESILAMAEFLYDAVLLIFYALPVVSVVLAVWGWIDSRNERREYLENHPRYLHSGGDRKPS